MIRTPLALASALLLVAAAATPALAEDARDPGCDVTSATLTWGFKESFRGYIDGSIANGEWTVADGATYETPSFGWPDGAGSIDPEALTGEVSFSGSLRFTGHGGILDTAIADPVVRFDGPDRATLLLDVRGETMEGEAVDAPGIEFATIDLSGVGTLTRAGDVVRVEGAPTELTAAGAEAFPNYPAGEAFDPVSLEFAVTDECALGDSAGEGVIGDATPFVVLIASLAGVLVLIVVILVVARRRR